MRMLGRSLTINGWIAIGAVFVAVGAILWFAVGSYQSAHERRARAENVGQRASASAKTDRWTTDATVDHVTTSADLEQEIANARAKVNALPEADRDDAAFGIACGMRDYKDTDDCRRLFEARASKAEGKSSPDRTPR